MSIPAIQSFAVQAVILGLLAFLTRSPTRAAFTEQGPTVLGSVGITSISASLADIDDDGDLDMFFQGGTNARQVFRNNIIGTGSFTFTNITSAMNITGVGESWSAAWGDYDGDGRVDVFVGQTNSGSNRGDVLRNSARGFVNTSTAVGLNDPGFHQNVAWSDINNDNRLDLVIGMEGPEKHAIYLQAAAGTFDNVGAETGFQVDYGTKAYGMAIGDTDGDGDMDVYISTCRPGGDIRNNFFQNMLVETGTLGFVDIADSNGTQYMDNSYGAQFLDFNDDGRLDLFMAGADGNLSKIWRNDGNNMFTDVDAITGHPLLSDTSTDLNGARAIDYDNDGDLDLFFHDHLAGSKNNARKLYRNDGNWMFTDVTASEGIATTNRGAYDSTWGDLDRDGDQDLVAPTNSLFPESIFVNDASTNGNHWLYVELEGPPGNTTGIGATLYAMIDDGSPERRTLRREANTNAGTFNQSDLPVHIGLGAVSAIEQLLIQWPNGTKQALFGVAADQYLTVSYLPGDYNGDGAVGAADYVVWRDGMGTNYNANDYTVWRAHFGQSTAEAASTMPAVPEPATVATIFAGFCTVWIGRRAKSAAGGNVAGWPRPARITSLPYSVC
jgi:hypothetical protein